MSYKDLSKKIAGTSKTNKPKDVITVEKPATENGKSESKKFSK